MEVNEEGGEQEVSKAELKDEKNARIDKQHSQEGYEKVKDAKLDFKL